MTNINSILKNLEAHAKMLLTGTNISYVCNMVFSCVPMYKQIYIVFIHISRHVLIDSKIFSVFSLFVGSEIYDEKTLSPFDARFKENF